MGPKIYKYLKYLKKTFFKFVAIMESGFVHFAGLGCEV